MEEGSQKKRREEKEGERSPSPVAGLWEGGEAAVTEEGSEDTS